MKNNIFSQENNSFIVTENYLLVVSDDDIKWREDFLDLTDNTLWKNDSETPMSKTLFPECKKIIAHKPLNGASFIDGVDELPECGFDVRKLSIEMGNEFYVGGNYDFENGVRKGYNKAKETFNFTKQDMIDFACEVFNTHYYNGDMSFKKRAEAMICSYTTNNNVIPIGFECEFETFFIYNGKEYLQHEVPKSAINKLLKTNRKIKTITNSQGRTEWVGKYVYNK
jgi:hypothetical protein